MCCGGFMLLLGGIFALTLKEPGVVMVGPGGMPLQQNQMLGAQYPQPVQQQYTQQPVQQQYAQQPVQQQSTTTSSTTTSSAKSIWSATCPTKSIRSATTSGWLLRTLSS